MIYEGRVQGAILQVKAIHQEKFSDWNFLRVTLQGALLQGAIFLSYEPENKDLYKTKKNSSFG